MTNNNLLFCLIALYCSLATGCASSGKGETDSDTDTSTTGDTSDIDTDTNSETNDDTTTATFGGTEPNDTDTATDRATDSDTDSMQIIQSPLKIHVTNTSPAIVYLNAIQPLRGESKQGNDWVTTSIFPPSCMMECDSITDTENTFGCCIDCAMAMNAYGILPGDTLTFDWNGQVHPVDTTYCTCGCYSSENPIAGEYRFIAGVYSTVECGMDSCNAPAESGVWEGVLVSGERRDYLITTAIPTNSDVIEIVIARDSSCDDGSVPTCDMVAPTCDPASQILAWRNDCYQCVNPETCAP